LQDTLYLRYLKGEDHINNSDLLSIVSIIKQSHLS